VSGFYQLANWCPPSDFISWLIHSEKLDAAGAYETPFVANQAGFSKPIVSCQNTE
jgi:hypothetical protein